MGENEFLIIMNLSASDYPACLWSPAGLRCIFNLVRVVLLFNLHTFSFVSFVVFVLFLWLPVFMFILAPCAHLIL